jgi:ppGpp synthetase/RelA/SpoT-type nucleotidyltranferase
MIQNTDINLETYKTIINIIYEEHNKHTKNWIENQVATYNLANKNICDIYTSNENEEYINQDFKRYMSSYLKTLGELYLKIMIRINEECNIVIRGRVKSPESINLKMSKKSKDDNGKFPIYRCLNDLLGIRIIDSNYNKNIELVEIYLNELRDQGKFRIRHLIRENKDYRAYHIYFRGLDNKYFPIELQIWNIENEQSNLTSHEIYKKEYTSWTDDYKNDLV